MPAPAADRKKLIEKLADQLHRTVSQSEEPKIVRLLASLEPSYEEWRSVIDHKCDVPNSRLRVAKILEPRVVAALEAEVKTFNDAR